ncbi:splicing factor YJU2 [Oratosquilla oratoria]|uniref:splicing factor YJU2 n=1 Tax=Oratosquilla oratoria TaxID=337810 RepID=UPI003F775547
MSERKVLNKYYPPDFDPSKIPRARCPKNRQFTVRLMAPCNMKCLTCGEYIAKGKKFNARKEDVENMSYLGIRIYRFYIKCPGCLAEISFRTDPESTDYTIEAGAHRNFQALKLAEELAAKEEKEAREEIESNPMLLLENRTQQSQYEMEVLESLEDLRELNERHAGVDLNKMVQKYEEERQLTKEQQEEHERLEALMALGYEMVEGELVRKVNNDEDLPRAKKMKFSKEDKPTDALLESDGIKETKKISLKSKFAGLVKVKKTTPDSLTTGNKPSSLPIRPSDPETSSKTVKNQASPEKENSESKTDKANLPASPKETNQKTGSNGDTSSSVPKNGVISSSALLSLGAYSDSDSNSDE